MREDLRLRRGGWGGLIRRSGRRPAELRAQLVASLLKLLLQLLLLFLHDFRVDRRAVKGFAEASQRHLESDLPALVAELHIERGAFLHPIDEGFGRLPFCETAVWKADHEFAFGRAGLVDAESDARGKKQAEGKNETGNLLRLAVEVVDGDRKRGLALIRNEVAGCVANLLIGRRIIAAELQPIGLGGLGLELLHLAAFGSCAGRAAWRWLVLRRLCGRRSRCRGRRSRGRRRPRGRLRRRLGLGRSRVRERQGHQRRSGEYAPSAPIAEKQKRHVNLSGDASGQCGHKTT